MHIGSSSSLVITSPGAPIDCLITLTPINIVQAATDIIWSGILTRFPDLRIALSEGGIRVDPVLPRADRLPVPPAPLLDRPGLRRPPAERGVQ